MEKIHAMAQIICSLYIRLAWATSFSIVDLPSTAMSTSPSRSLPMFGDWREGGGDRERVRERAREFEKSQREWGAFYKNVQNIRNIRPAGTSPPVLGERGRQ
jgi:hypothetical protein